MHGREEVKAWMAGLMVIEPFDTQMVFEIEWVLMDYERSWVNYKLWNRMRDPGDGCVHQAALFTNLRYGGNNQWCFEEDIYNSEEMTKMVEEWNAAKRAVANGESTPDCSRDTTASATPASDGGPTVCGGTVHEVRIPVRAADEIRWRQERTDQVGPVSRFREAGGVVVPHGKPDDRRAWRVESPSEPEPGHDVPVVRERMHLTTAGE